MAEPQLEIDVRGDVEFCYLTTTGRASGRPHTIEIWFVAHEGSAYLMAGDGRSDWVQNLRRDPHVRLRIDDVEVDAVARVVDDDAQDPRQPVVRERMADKYDEREADGSLSTWARRAVVVEVAVRDAPIA
jgi:deazaflavin-dependent oxidoreductase (nitroreductase family)